MQNAIILLSGGLDSATTAYYVKNKIKPKEIIALFFDYGQKALKEEEFCAKTIAKKIGAKFEKLDFKWLGKISTAFLNTKNNLPKINEKDLADRKKGNKETTKYWVPCRNSLFLLTALAYAESKFIKNKKRYHIFIGLKCEGSVPMKDTTMDFVKQVNKFSESATNDGGYKIIAPLIKEDKDDIITVGTKLKVPYKFTYSCFSGSGFKNKMPVHCGSCMSCMLRKKAFYWANVKDPSYYYQKRL